MPQYFDSTAAFPMKTKKSVYAKGGRAKYYGGGRTNLLEELGRVGAKDGNWIQKVNKSIEKRGTKGKCTPITKPGCTGRAKALAKTFKKMARERKSA